MSTWLTHRRLPVAAAILAVVLTLPSLGVGWIADDHFHRFAMLGSRLSSSFFDSPMDVFQFLDGDPERTGRLMDLGVLPWWTFTEVKGAFWRPVTVLTHWLDYRLWPECPALMHAHSLLWFGGLAAAVACLYRRFMGPVWVAGAAAFLYAVDDAHGWPVGFLANRNALIATVFGVLALLAHDRWRRDGWRAGAVVAPLLLAASLLSAEAGVATCAYLAAHAVFLDRSPWRQRCLVLIPYAVVVLVWRITWTHLGYGISDVGLYVDPIGEPVRFAVAALHRAPILLLSQWALPPSDVAMLLGPAGLKWLWLAAVAFLMLLAVMLTPLLRRDRLARFWALGTVLSVVPICATFPMDRLLFFVGIGAMGLLAQFLAAAFSRPAWSPERSVWRIAVMALGCFFVALHLVIAPIALPVRAGYPIGPKKLYDQFCVLTPMDDSVAKQDVVVVNAPNEVVVGYLPVLRALDGQPVPRHTRALAPALYGVVIHRPDAHTLVIRSEDQPFWRKFNRLLRSERHPMSLGERVELTGLMIEVTDLTSDGWPVEASFRFAVPLEDPSLRWLQWKAGVFVPFTPPAIGERVELRQPKPALWPFRKAGA